MDAWNGSEQILQLPGKLFALALRNIPDPPPPGKDDTVVKGSWIGSHKGLMPTQQAQDCTLAVIELEAGTIVWWSLSQFTVRPLSCVPFG